MPSYNRVTLIGNLVRDPELKAIPSGQSLCSFRLAISEKWKAKDGTEKTRVCYVDVKAWGRMGEVIHQYVTKGQPIFVDGRLSLNEWQDKDTGKTRQRLEVVMERFQFLSFGKRDAKKRDDEADDREAADHLAAEQADGVIPF